jgi:hypothetical protein
MISTIYLALVICQLLCWNVCLHLLELLHICFCGHADMPACMRYPRIAGAGAATCTLRIAGTARGVQYAGANLCRKYPRGYYPLPSLSAGLFCEVCIYSYLFKFCDMYTWLCWHWFVDCSNVFSAYLLPWHSQIDCILMPCLFSLFRVVGLDLVVALSMVAMYKCIGNCDLNIVLQFLAISVNANSSLFPAGTRSGVSNCECSLNVFMEFAS